MLGSAEMLAAAAAAKQERWAQLSSSTPAAIGMRKHVVRSKVSRTSEMDDLDVLANLFAEDSDDNERGSVASQRSDFSTRSTRSTGSTESRTSTRSFRQWTLRAKQLEKEMAEGISRKASAEEEMTIMQLLEEVERPVRPQCQFRKLSPGAIAAAQAAEKVSL